MAIYELLRSLALSLSLNCLFPFAKFWQQKLTIVLQKRFFVTEIRNCLIQNSWTKENKQHFSCQLIFWKRRQSHLTWTCYDGDESFWKTLKSLLNGPGWENWVHLATHSRDKLCNSANQSELAQLSDSHFPHKFLFTFFKVVP